MEHILADKGYKSEYCCILPYQVIYELSLCLCNMYNAERKICVLFVMIDCWLTSREQYFSTIHYENNLANKTKNSIGKLVDR